MVTAATLLPSKLAPPTTRARRVLRPRLVERLEQGLQGPLVLIAAPAGFGKTTLLAEWLERSPERAVAWLALDAGDNDPARFWSYVISAIQAERPGFASRALTLLGLPGDSFEELTAELARELTESAEPLVLVFDDFHAIEAQAVHSALTFLLDHLPPWVHLVISTRTDPPLPLARLRARGQLAELRAADLRFTPDEAAALVSDVMGVQLPHDQMDTLDERTEGWAAGLQLAALSLQNRSEASDRAAFVAAFGGSHRFILDYLVDEVLTYQPEDLVRFLLDTSILDRLSASLCEAVTGESACQALLERIERANLFLLPLDEERAWYRYHHLFAEALRHRLARDAPKRVQELHRRASAWFANAGEDLMPAAVEHALAAHDWASAAQLIDALLGPLHARGERETVRRWLQQVPDHVQRQHPLLLVSAGQAWLHAGEFDRAAAVAREAERLAEPASVTLARALLLEANLAQQRGEPARAVACAERAQALLPADDVRGQAALAVLLGSSYLSRGDLAAAERILMTARAPAEQPAVGWLLRTDRGVLDTLRGRLVDAAQRHEALIDEIGELNVVYAVEQRWRLSTITLEWNDLDRTATLLDDAFARLERAHAEVFRARLQLTRARLCAAREDLDGALRASETAATAAMHVGSALQLRWAHALQARIQLQRGESLGAEAWAAGLRGARDLASSEREQEALVLARVELARGEAKVALELLERMLERAEAGGHESSAIGILVLHALACEALGERDRATSSLASALRRGVAGNFRRVYLDEGSSMVSLLRRARSAAPALVASLLDSLDTPPSDNLVSAREMEVLLLVAEGLSNREIAERLIVAPNTVKAHVRHLGTKLGASSRTQLLARARESGLL